MKKYVLKTSPIRNIDMQVYTDMLIRITPGKALTALPVGMKSNIFFTPSFTALPKPVAERPEVPGPSSCQREILSSCS